MDTLHCSFCDHENPVDAKFCNACGSSLHLQLCKHCGAIDDASSRSCYKCGTPFGFAWADGDPARSRAPHGASSANADGGGGSETPAADRSGAEWPAPAAADAKQEGAAGVVARGLRLDGMRALSLVLFVVAAIFAFQLFTADDAPPAIKRNIVDATLGAVPPRDPAAVELVPVAAPADEPSPEPRPAQAVPPEAPPERAVTTTPEPEKAEAPAAVVDDAPPYPCSAEVEALGLCD